MKWSKSVDRHLEELTTEGTLQKLSQGLYYFPRESALGKAPPDEAELVRGFLKDDRFLLTSPNAYNSLGVGTTQLYNQRTVYNHKRHGEFKLGNSEFLLVDLVNNLETLAEDRTEILKNVTAKVRQMNTKKLKNALSEYGNLKARHILMPLLNKAEAPQHAF